MLRLAIQMHQESYRLLAERLSGSSLREPLRSALRMATMSDPPIQGVNALARNCGVSRRWLAKCWRNHPTDGLLNALKEFLALIRLLRALNSRAEGVSWALSASRAGISVRTLRRETRRYLGAPPTRLDHQDIYLAIEEIVDQLLCSVGQSTTRRARGGLSEGIEANRSGSGQVPSKRRPVSPA